MVEASVGVDPRTRFRIWSYRAALIGTLVYIVIGALIQQAKVGHSVDFKQYYMAAWVARTGSWDVLYPVPITGGRFNAGWDATAKPALRELSHRAGAGEPANFIQPPAAALPMAPLAWLGYSRAEQVWAGLAAVAVWGAAVLGGRLVRLASGAGELTALETFAVMLVVLHPRSILLLSHGNISPFVGLAIATSIYGLSVTRGVLASAGIGMAAVLKVSPVALFPLMAFQRPLRGGVVGGLGVATALLATCFVTGLKPWIEFAVYIVPTLGRPWLPLKGEGELELMTSSIYAIGWWLTRKNPLPSAVLWSISASAFITYVLVVGLVAWRWSRGLVPSKLLVSAAFALVAWSLMFSPLFWDHYSFYYSFGTGWLLTRLRMGPARAIAAGAALFFLWAPWGRVPPFSVPAVGHLTPLFAASAIFVTGALDLLLTSHTHEPPERLQKARPPLRKAPLLDASS